MDTISEAPQITYDEWTAWLTAQGVPRTDHIGVTVLPSYVGDGYVRLSVSLLACGGGGGRQALSIKLLSLPGQALRHEVSFGDLWAWLNAHGIGEEETLGVSFVRSGDEMMLRVGTRDRSIRDIPLRAFPHLA